MAHLKDDNTVTRDSVFDWGLSRDGEGSRSSMGSGNDGAASPPSSRYDPKAMSRIVDITDLVDDSSDGDTDDEGIVAGHSSTRGSVTSKGSSATSREKKRRYHLGQPALAARQVFILAALVGIIAAASLAIGYAVTNSDGNTNSVRGGEPQNEQHLLEIAERIVTACAESRLDADMGECQKLCKKKMCCFESGKYGCAEDEKKECAVYAGCEALVEGTAVGAPEEDEE